MNSADLFELIRPERRRVTISVVLAAISGVLLYPTLWLVRELFDSAIPASDGWRAILVCVGILVVRLAAAEASLLQRIVAMRAAKGAAALRRKQLLRWLLNTDVGSLETQDHSLIQSRLVHETERVDVMLNRALSVAVPALVAALLAFSAMTVLEWRLALLTILFGLPVSWLIAHGSARTTTATRAFQRGYERFTSAVQFVVRHMLLVRSRGHVAQEQAHQDEAIDDLRNLGVTMALSFARQGRRQMVSVTTIAVAVLALGSLLVIEGNLTVGELAAFYVSALVCGNAVGLIGSAVPDLKGGMVAIERLAELADPSTPPAKEGAILPNTILPVCFRDVDFAYGDRPVLSGINFELAAGTHVDLRGINGAGKSTLIRLALALEQPVSGKVTAGTTPLEELDGELFRRHIGFAPQRPTFFSGSVLENLLYGRPDSSRADAESAVALVGMSDAIARLKGGLDASLGEDGSRLSGGEGQRLAIARALLGKPDLVVLDEPGNHLPQHAVTEIVARLRSARPEIALLTAGHGHLESGVADLSLRLEDGHLTEMKING